MGQEEEKYIVYTAMERFGGSFVQALGKALMMADVNNVLRIKNAFPEYWKKYLEIGLKMEERK